MTDAVNPYAIKTHVKRHGFRIVTPTVPLVRYWWNKINLELWEGMLPAPVDIKVKRDTVCWAFTNFPDHGKYGLEIDSYPLTKKRLIEVLVHESVHAWLFVFDHDSRTWHGPNFMAYAPKVKKILGVELSKEIRI
jgi:hypothetical protein